MVVFWVLFGALAIFLIVNAAMPADLSSQESGKVELFLSKILTPLFPGEKPVHERWEWFPSFVRKAIGHFGAFGLLGVLGSLALCYTTERNFRSLVSLSMGVFMAVLTECIQLFADGRAFAVRDILIDTAGYVIGGGIIFLIFMNIFTKKERK